MPFALGPNSRVSLGRAPRRPPMRRSWPMHESACAALRNPRTVRMTLARGRGRSSSASARDAET
jgi:hypothetical protein